ncbi:hypothetical protein RHIZO_04178 [Rhizobiaceae bacterium]|nr:hypothetical protein RHIZO_04178 [Rhizobiaceae bacterium]
MHEVGHLTAAATATAGILSLSVLLAMPVRAEEQTAYDPIATEAEYAKEARLNAMARIGEAIRYAEECEGLSLDRDRAFEVATAVGLPSSSIVSAHAQSSSSMITAPIIGLPKPPPLPQEECDYGYGLYGPEGRLLPGLLARSARRATLPSGIVD